MNPSDVYYTISEAATALFKDKGSKFFAFAYPINSEEEIKEILQSLKKEHHTARHHCYAFRLQPDGSDYRFSDDGEPSGTAGRPIYGQLLSKNLTNILVVVVRYFGGTLLGVGGLINAYKTATNNVLKTAIIKECVLHSNAILRFDYSAQSIVMRKIDEFQGKILNSVYESSCTFTVGIPMSMFQKFEHEFDEMHEIKIEKI